MAFVGRQIPIVNKKSARRTIMASEIHGLSKINVYETGERDLEIESGLILRRVDEK